MYFSQSRKALVAFAGALAIAAGALASNGSAAAAPSCPSYGSASASQLWIPPRVTGTDVKLTLAPSSRQFFAGALTPTIGYGGCQLWGPTIVMQQGTTVHMHVTNALGEPTTTHWHGIHLPAAADGGPMQVIKAGATWSPSFKVLNHAATYWYHPHLDEKTNEQLMRGAGGFIIVNDPQESALRLPRTYGVDDIPLFLSSRRFTAAKAIDTDVSVTPYGDFMLTNGVMNAQVSLPKQLVRLRLLNVETERAYNLGFADNRTFQVIGTDGGLLNKPVPVTRLPLYPGERYEVLVDLSNDRVGGSLKLQAFNVQPFGFPGAEPASSGTFGSLLNNRTFNVLSITVKAATAGAVTKVPATLAHFTFPTLAQASVRRTISITDQGPGTPFTFDGKGYGMSRIDQRVKLGATEAWTIKNNQTFSHSFHIHDVQFFLVGSTDGPVPAYRQGWKDTFPIAQNVSTTFVATFLDFASPTDAYMYHCHMANHEDEGLMSQFLVVK